MGDNTRFGAVMALCGLAAACETLRLPLADGISLSGARVVPLAASALMALFGLAVCASGMRKKKAAAGTGSGPGWKTVLTVVGLLLVYAWVLPGAGFLLSTFVLLLFLSCLFGLRKPVHAALLSGAATGMTWLVFTRVFFANLPSGTWF